jgi:hypothetical protein
MKLAAGNKKRMNSYETVVFQVKRDVSYPSPSNLHKKILNNKQSVTKMP